MSATVMTGFDLQAEIDAAAAERKAEIERINAQRAAKQAAEQEEKFEKDKSELKETLERVVGEDILTALNIKYEFNTERRQTTCVACFVFSGIEVEVAFGLNSLHDRTLIFYLACDGEHILGQGNDPNNPYEINSTSLDHDNYREQFLLFLACLQLEEFQDWVKTQLEPETQINRLQLEINRIANESSPEPEELSMTRRDWIVGFILSGWLANPTVRSAADFDAVISEAYKIADKAIKSQS